MEDKIIIPDEIVVNKIYYIREQKIMLDNDLAQLYDVETRVLNQQVKRNSTRFPKDFMFQLTEREWDVIKLQDNSTNWGGRRTAPYAFTEHGILMLSSVLNSKKAIAINIQIVRIFTKLRELVLTNKDLIIKIEKLKKQVAGQDEKIDLIYNYLIEFVEQEKAPRKKIGFKRDYNNKE